MTQKKSNADIIKALQEENTALKIKLEWRVAQIEAQINNQEAEEARLKGTIEILKGRLNTALVYPTDLYKDKGKDAGELIDKLCD